jgi:hypothetical protein
MHKYKTTLLLLTFALATSGLGGPFDVLTIPVPYSDEDFNSLEQYPEAAAYAAKMQLSELNKRTIQLNEQYSFVSCGLFQDVRLDSERYYMMKVNLTVKLSDWRVKDAVNPPRPVVMGLLITRGDRVLAWWVSEETFDRVLRSKKAADIDTQPFEVAGKAIFIERQ